jgi:uncharacterized protein
LQKASSCKIIKYVSYLESENKKTVYVLYMRKSNREIKNQDLIQQVIAKAEVCRLGLCKDNKPYIVPVNFGYDGSFIYFHTAIEGMKIDYLGANRQVCFEMEHDVRLIPHADEACKWSISYYSVIGFGTIKEIVDLQHKIFALNQIMQHYSNRQWTFDEQSIKKTRVWGISIEQITGKQSEDKIAKSAKP